MRTTLDIDDDVLQAAKELARAEKKTAGQVLSDLARTALTSPGGKERKPVFKDGWYTLPSTGRIVTHEMVERLIEEADLEDAGIAIEQARARAPRR